MKTILALVITLLLTSCSSKLTPPVQLEDNQKKSINHMLLNKPNNNVPKGVYLNETIWDATMTIYKKNKYYFENDKIIKAFYLAHHADYILIKGDEDLITYYKRYLHKNAVKAEIILQPNPYSKYKSNKIEFYFKHYNVSLDNNLITKNGN